MVISDIENNIIKPAKDGSKKGEREISRFIKELSVALFQSYPVDNQRAIEICEILEAFFGISPTLADPDNIRKYIQGEIL